MPTKCDACGETAVEMREAGGLPMRFGLIPDLPVPAGVMLPICESCGEIWLTPELDAELQKTLKQEYEAAMTEKVDACIRMFEEKGIRRRTVEALAGISPGYLSRLDRGKKTSTRLVSLLLALAHEPGLALRLSNLWRMTPESVVEPLAGSIAHAPAKPLDGVIFGANEVQLVLDGEVAHAAIDRSIDVKTLPARRHLQIVVAKAEGTSASGIAA